MGKASRQKREGRPPPRGKADKVVLWGVMMDGQLGNFLFPTAETAEAEARRIREEHPASVLEWCQVGITVLMRRPLKPKIAVVRSAETLVTP